MIQMHASIRDENNRTNEGEETSPESLTLRLAFATPIPCASEDINTCGPPVQRVHDFPSFKTRGGAGLAEKAAASVLLGFFGSVRSSFAM